MDNDYSFTKYVNTLYCPSNSNKGSNVSDESLYQDNTISINNNSSNDSNVNASSFPQDHMEYNYSSLDNSQSCVINESLIIHQLGIDDSPSNEKQVTTIDDISKLTDNEYHNYSNEPFTTSFTTKSDLNRTFDMYYNDYTTFTPIETLPDSELSSGDSGQYFTDKYDLSNNESYYQSDYYLQTLLSKYDQNKWDSAATATEKYNENGINKLSTNLSYIDSNNAQVCSVLDHDVNVSNALTTEYIHSNQSSSLSIDSSDIINWLKSSDLTPQKSLATSFSEANEHVQSLDSILSSLFNDFEASKSYKLSDVLVFAMISYTLKTNNHKVFHILINYTILNKFKVPLNLASEIVQSLLNSSNYTLAHDFILYCYKNGMSFDDIILDDNFPKVFDMCHSYSKNDELKFQIYQHLLKCNVTLDTFNHIIDLLIGIIDLDSQFTSFLNSSTILIIIKYFIKTDDWDKLFSFMNSFLPRLATSSHLLVEIINSIIQTNATQIQSVFRVLSELKYSSLPLLLYAFVSLHLLKKTNLIYMIYADSIDIQLNNIPIELKSLLSVLSVPVFCFDFEPSYITNLLENVLKIGLNTPAESNPENTLTSQLQSLSLSSSSASDQSSKIYSFVFSDNLFDTLLPILKIENVFCLLQLSVASFDLDSINSIIEFIKFTQIRDLSLLTIANNAFVNFGHLDKSKLLLERATASVFKTHLNASDSNLAKEPFPFPNMDSHNWFSYAQNLLACTKGIETELTNVIPILSSLYSHSFIVSLILSKFDLAHYFLSSIINNKLTIEPSLYTAMSHFFNTVSSNLKLDQLLLLADILQYNMTNDLYHSILNSCLRLHSPEHLLSSINKFRKLGFHPDLQTFALLIKFFSSSDNVKECFHLWNEMISRYGYELNEVTYGCMFDALVSNNLLDDALNLLKEMKKKSSVKPNTIIYSTLIKGFGQTKQLSKAVTIYLTMLDEGVLPNTITYNSIIDACARVGDMNKATSLLEDMLNNNIEPDLITFSTIIKGYCVQSNMDRALQLLRSMTQRGIKPDGILYNSLLDGCVKSSRFDLSQKIWNEMQENGIPPSNFTLTILIKMYGRTGQLDKAFQLMEEFPVKYKFQTNTHVYTCLMSACITNGKYNMALEVFESMKRNGVLPDLKTYETILSGAIKGRLFYEIIDIIKDAFSFNNHGNGAPNKSILKIESRILSLFAQKVESSGDPVLLQQAKDLAAFLKKYNIILPLRLNFNTQNTQAKRSNISRRYRHDSILLDNMADPINDYHNPRIDNQYNSYCNYNNRFNSSMLDLEPDFQDQSYLNYQKMRNQSTERTALKSYKLDNTFNSFNTSPLFVDRGSKLLNGNTKLNTCLYGNYPNRRSNVRF